MIGRPGRAPGAADGSLPGRDPSYRVRLDCAKNDY